MTQRRVAQGFDFSDTTKKWVPRPCAFCKGGYDAAESVGFVLAISRFFREAGKTGEGRACYTSLNLCHT